MENNPLAFTDFSSSQMETALRLKSDLDFYARNCLKIEDKQANLIPWQFNKAQQYLHAEIEDQIKRTGMVRKLIVKGRQQGCSTYTEGRFFHKVLWNPRIKAQILSHDDKSASGLFRMVQTFYNNCPVSMRPRTLKMNTEGMELETGSLYRINTAGSKDSGRSMTAQLFHGSEVAYYADAQSTLAGIGQIVATMAGTEIILESTANGVSNAFYELCMNALAGIGQYELIFIPWHWQPEYTLTPPPGWYPNDYERNLKETHNLTDGQLYWRKNKIHDLLNSESLFQQEYPFTVHEAFQASGDPLIPANLIEDATKAFVNDPFAPVVAGCDPARQGDRTCLVIRRGREIIHLQTWNDMDEMRLAGILSEAIQQYQIQKCFVDVAYGNGTVDRLKERGFGSVVEGVHFGQKPIDDKRYKNKRAEMAGCLLGWFNDGPVRIPPREDLVKELRAIPGFKQDSSNKFVLEKKDKIKELMGGVSPDLFDAMMLTFAYPVKSAMMFSNGVAGGSIIKVKGPRAQTYNSIKKRV